MPTGPTHPLVTVTVTARRRPVERTVETHLRLLRHPTPARPALARPAPAGPSAEVGAVEKETAIRAAVAP
ncbi:hypothetical protein AB1484_26510 [Parafrankia sp. FMc6]|uniref:hypothetical protein n=1 Tax=Parafrankia soli TaxID=2599596 RepID=UPI0034D67076